MTAPNCHACQHRRSGPERMSCAHPVAAICPMTAARIVHTTGGLHLTADAGHGIRATTFRLRVDQHGLDQGLADWPFTFDPIWIRECTGFKERVATLVEVAHEG